METKKIYGLTLYLSDLDMDTIYGKYTCKIFKNFLNQNYIFAICHGDMSSEILYTRMHSSCVSSETFCSLDCDCSLQLEMAFKTISKMGNGIIFYLLQEGRGAGYIFKARGLQLGQSMDGKITTFEAYKSMGLKEDYRNYEGIGDILKILEINSKFVLLTNNPDKIKAASKIFQLEGLGKIEFDPNPFNGNYLQDKAKNRHYLSKTKTPNLFINSKNPNNLFDPYPISNDNKLIYCSNYDLPIKPLNDTILLEKEGYEALLSAAPSLILNCDIIRMKYLIKYDSQEHVKCLLSEGSDILLKYLYSPFWFKVHVYYDTHIDDEVVILEYKEEPLDNSITPYLFIYEVNVFDRFPLSKHYSSRGFSNAVVEIVKNGYGYIKIINKDQKNQSIQRFLNKSHEFNANYEDFKITADVLKHLTKTVKYVLLYENAKEHMLKFYEDILKGFELTFIKLEKEVDVKGDSLLLSRITSIKEDFDQYMGIIGNQESKLFEWLKGLDVSHYPYMQAIITGVGSSKAHGQYLKNLMQKYTDIHCEFCDIEEMPQKSVNKKAFSLLIIISQGLSPNSEIVLDKSKEFNQVILITSVSENNKNESKTKLLKQVERRGFVFRFPLEDEYTLLIRIIGPFFGYISCYYLCRGLSLLPEFNSNQVLAEFPEDLVRSMLNQPNKQSPDSEFTQSLLKTKNIIIMGNYPYLSNYMNLSFKFMEGIYVSKPSLVSNLEFSHGYYQQLANNKNDAVFIIFDDFDSSCSFLSEKNVKSLANDFKFWRLTSDLPEDIHILQYEMDLNYYVYNLIVKLGIDQKNFLISDSYNITKL